MKICRILYAYSPYSLGGADMRAEIISKETAKRGNPTVIISISPDKRRYFEEGDDNEKIYRFHPFNISTFHQIGRESAIRQGIWTALDIYNPYSYMKIKEVLRRERPDVVHIHTPVDLTLSAFEAVKNLRLPLVFTLHDYLLLCRRIVLLHGSGEICTEKNINPLCKIYRCFARRIINKNVDVVIAPSRFVLELHKKNGFFTRSMSVVLPHGIELNNFLTHDTKDYKDEGRHSNILYVGSLTQHKGVHILIDAFSRLRNKRARLHIVGGGIYESELKKLSADNKDIIFHGKLPNEEVRKFYLMADILVVPSIWYDVRPNVIVEGLKYGVPVLASKIGGIPELIKDNYNGILFNPGDKEQLRKAIEGILDDPLKLDSLRKNTYESVRQYEMSNYISKLIEVYKEAIEINRMRFAG